MRTQVHFNHMDRSEALEDHAVSRFEGVVEEFLKREDCHLQIWLIAEKSHQHKGPSLFRCEVDVRFAPKRELFMAKSSQDMYDAINLTAHALSQVIREESKKEIQQRRNHG